MNNFIIEGIVREVSERREFESRDGARHTVRTIVVETEEMYPQTAALHLIDVAEDVLPEIGAHVQCHVTLRARFITKEENGKTKKIWFTDLKAWRVTK